MTIYFMLMFDVRTFSDCVLYCKCQQSCSMFSIHRLRVLRCASFRGIVSLQGKERCGHVLATSVDQHDFTVSAMAADWNDLIILYYAI